MLSGVSRYLPDSNEGLDYYVEVVNSALGMCLYEYKIRCFP